MRARSGVVLLLALLAIVALELGAAALHFAALQQLRAARSGARALQLRLSAESAVAAAVNAWPTVQAWAVPVGGSFSIAAAAGREPRYGIAFTVAAERLDRDLFLIRAEARSVLRESARVGFLLVRPDLGALLATAALRTVGRTSLGAGAMLAAGTGSCDLSPLPAALELSSAGDVTVSPGARLDGAIAVRSELPGAALEALLPFDLSRLLSNPATTAPANVTPAPVALGGTCVTTAPANWGEPYPAAGTSPCATWYPVITAGGDLTIAGGRGQGMLYVPGNLVVNGAATFAGVVLVAGNVTVEAGASLNGVVLAGGDVVLRDGTIQGDRCASSAALAAVSALTGPFGPATRRWLPIF